MNLTDIERVIADLTPKARSETAAKVAADFAQQGLGESERPAAENFFRLLVKDGAVGVRETLSAHLKTRTDLPHDIALALATDVESVALPLLAYSEVLNETDLMEIIAENSRAKQTAIAQRRDVAAPVADALIDSGNEAAVAKLVANEATDLSTKALARIMDDYGDNEAVTDAVLRRVHLPPSALDRSGAAIPAAAPTGGTFRLIETASQNSRRFQKGQKPADSNSYAADISAPYSPNTKMSKPRRLLNRQSNLQKSDAPTFLLHWSLVLTLVFSLVTGLRIAADAEDASWARAVAAVLPQGDVIRWHLWAALSLLSIAAAYVVFLLRARLTQRITLNRQQLNSLVAANGQNRWHSVNILLYWVAFACIFVAGITGILLYVAPGLLPYLSVSAVHQAVAWSIVVYAVLHIATQTLMGGLRQLLKILKPQRAYGVAAALGLMAATGTAAAFYALERSAVKALEVGRVDAVPVADLPLEPVAFAQLEGIFDPPSLPLRVGEHPGFSRLVFDWPTRTAYRISQSQKWITVRFDAPAQLDLSEYRLHGLLNVSELAPEVGPKELTVVLTTPSGVGVRHFYHDTHVVVDVLRDGGPEKLAASGSPEKLATAAVIPTRASPGHLTADENSAPKAQERQTAFAATAAGGQETAAEVTRVNAVPVIDGFPNDGVWERVSAVEIHTSRGANLPGGEVTVSVRALHDDEYFYGLFEWPDTTRSLKHLPLVKTEDGWKVMQRDFGNQDEDDYYEDKFAVMLANSSVLAGAGTSHLGDQPLEGKPGPAGGRGLHYTTDGSIVDVWHWKAVRSGSEAMNQIDDNYFGPPMEPNPEKSRYTGGYTKDPKTGGGIKMNWEAFRDGIVRPLRLPKESNYLDRFAMVDPDPDVGDSASLWMPLEQTVPYSGELDQYPVGTIMPSVLVEGPFQGDRGDVDAVARWHEGVWHLEVRRKLDTGSKYDIAIKPGQPVYMWVAVFDHTQTRHSQHLHPVKLLLE